MGVGGCLRGGFGGEGYGKGEMGSVTEWAFLCLCLCLCLCVRWRKGAGWGGDGPNNNNDTVCASEKVLRCGKRHDQGDAADE